MTGNLLEKGGECKSSCDLVAYDVYDRTTFIFRGNELVEEVSCFPVLINRDDELTTVERRLGIVKPEEGNDVATLLIFRSDIVEQGFITRCVRIIAFDGDGEEVEDDHGGLVMPLLIGKTKEGITYTLKEPEHDMFVGVNIKQIVAAVTPMFYRDVFSFNELVILNDDSCY